MTSSHRKWRNATVGFAIGLAALPLVFALWPIAFAAWVWNETE